MTMEGVHLPAWRRILRSLYRWLWFWLRRLLSPRGYELKNGGSQMSQAQRPEEVIPPEGYLELPVPSYLHIQHLEKAISDLEQRIFPLEEVLSTFGSQAGAFGPAPAPQDPWTPPGHWPFPGPGFPSTSGPGSRPPAPLGIWWGPILHAPASQLLQVCVWSSVTVILVRRGALGGNTPMAGATVTFSITAGTGIAISSTAGGPGVRPVPR